MTDPRVVDWNEPVVPGRHLAGAATRPFIPNWWTDEATTIPVEKWLKIESKLVPILRESHGTFGHRVVVANEFGDLVEAVKRPFLWLPKPWTR